MARVDPHQGLVPSILDRLIDPGSAGTSARPGYSIDQMMERVREDLETLLNTRQTLSDEGKKREKIRHSILGFGLPEITSLQAITPQQRQEIAQLVRTTVARHEPRMRDIRVSLIEVEDTLQPTLHFRIEGRLAVEPSPQVAYDTLMEVSTGQHIVKQASSG